MSLQQTSQETSERMMEGPEAHLWTYRRSLIKNAFAQLCLGLLLLGMGTIQLINIFAENLGHPLLYTGVTSFILGAMTMIAGSSGLVVTRSMCSSSFPSSAKRMIILHVCLSMVTIPISLAIAAFSTKPTIDCLRNMEDCFPDAVKKGIWSLAIMVQFIVLFLLNTYTCNLFGKYGHLLGFSERLVVLCRARRPSGRDAQTSGMQRQQSDAIPQRDDKNWQPPSYEEAINMCSDGRTILPGVHSSCHVGDGDAPPKYEDVAAQETWRR